MAKLSSINLKLRSLSIFHSLYTQPLFIRVQYLLDKSQENDEMVFLDAYAQFVAYLYTVNENFSDCVLDAMMECETQHLKRVVLGKESSDILSKELYRELNILEELSKLRPRDFYDQISDVSLLADWATTEYNFIEEYVNRMENIHCFGYGMYAKYHMFTLQNHEIVPVKYPDPQRIADFSEYERERTLVIKNTRALLEGKRASNVLLYGDAGTGKSSTIKAIVNEYASEGLRLLEVKKNQLYFIPEIIEELAKNPLKFILFVDDLSFQSNDENFAALKSILEGGTSAISNNICIYATSNRRHLVKEDHQSRMGDEIHLNDTLQETMSLSSRFGLTITFNRPEKQTYITIVDEMAKQHGIEMDTEQLHIKAEAFAIRNHGRSPRTAKQFIDLLKNGF